MKGSIQRTLLCTALIISSHQVTAQDFYIGASAGLVKTDTGVSNITGTAKLDEKDTGFRLFGGMKINNNVAIELHYADLGEASLTGNTGDRFEIDGVPLQFIADNASIAGEVSNIGLSALIGLNSSETINPYFKIGLQRWDSKLTVSGPGGGASVSDDGTDPFFGFGLSIKISETLALQLDAERHDIDDDNTDILSAGLTYNFSN